MDSVRLSYLAFKPHQHIHAYGYRKSEIAHLKYKVFHLFLLSGAIDMQPGSGIIFKYGQICWKREVHIFRKREERKMKAVLERKKDRAKGGASKGLSLKNSA